LSPEERIATTSLLPSSFVIRHSSFPMRLSIALTIALLSITQLAGAQSRAWRQTQGPNGGAINCLAADADTIYAGTSYGVYRSINKGVTWIYAGVTRRAVLSLLITEGGVFAGTWLTGVFRSGNKGDTLGAVNNGIPANTSVAALAEYGGTLFAGTTGNGVYRSTNNGDVWSTANVGLTNLTVNAIVVRDSSLFAGTNGGVFRTTNNGDSWIKIDSGLQSNIVKALLVSGSRVYAGTFAGIHGIFESDYVWQQMDNGLPQNSTAIRAFAVVGTTVYAGTNGGVYRTSNNGATWTPVSNGVSDKNIYTLAATGQVLFAGTSYGGLYRSVNGGSLWSLAPVAATTVHLVAANAGTLLAGTFSSVNRSTDAGATWLPATIPNHTFLAYAQHGSNQFVGAGAGGVFRSQDNAATWMAVDAGLPDTTVTVSALTVQGQNLFAGTTRGMFRSGDDGDTWTAISTGLVDTIVVSLGATQNVLFAGTQLGGVFRSTNGGNSWSTTTTSLGTARVNAFEVVGTAVYAGTSGNGLYRTTNGGDAWVQQATGIPTTATVYALTTDGTVIFAGTDGGVFRSTDAGAMWQQVGLAQSTIGGVAISGTKVFAGTWGGGVFSADVFLNGIEEQRGVSQPALFTISPNPAGSVLHLRYAPGVMQPDIAIYTMSGEEVIHQCGSEGGEAEISVQALPVGMYMARFTSGRITSTQAVMIQR
jgi:photosystem II stability/assembly factor-like uncharacterized protein